MNFLKADEIRDLLNDYGIEQDTTDENHVFLRMSSGDTVQHLVLSIAGQDCEGPEGADRQDIAPEALPGVIQHLLQKLHHNQMVLVPVGKWRSVFDIVAFSMAENEDWQRIDAAASVELNSRDPLLADAGDLHILEELFQALMRDSDTPDQGLVLITVGVPVLMEIVPDRGIRLSFGNDAIAAEVREICAA